MADLWRARADIYAFSMSNIESRSGVARKPGSGKLPKPDRAARCRFLSMNGGFVPEIGVIVRAISDLLVSSLEIEILSIVFVGRIF